MSRIAGMDAGLKHALRGLLLGVGAGAALPAQAWIVDWTLGIGLQHSDNVERTALDPRSDTTLVPSVDFSVSEDGERLQVALLGSAAYYYYSSDDLSPDLRLTGAGRVNWTIAEERLSWVLEDYVAQVPIDPFASDSPDNLQTTNLFVTGPTARFRLGDTSRLQLDLRYANSMAEESATFDSNRLLLATRALRELTPLVTISANAETERVRLSDPTPTAPDYDRLALYGRYDRNANEVDLTVDVGWNRVEREGASNSDGTLFALTVDYRPTAVSSLRARFDRRLSDAAQNLALAAPGETELALPETAGVVGGGTITGDVAEQDRFDLGYRREVARLTFGITANWLDQRFLSGLTPDERSRSLIGSLDYDISPRAVAGVFATREQASFGIADSDFSETGYGVRFRYRPLENLTIVAEAARAQRRSDSDLDEFEETRYYLGLALTRRR